MQRNCFPSLGRLFCGCLFNVAKNQSLFIAPVSSFYISDFPARIPYRALTCGFVRETISLKSFSSSSASDFSSACLSCALTRLFIS